jgi:transposase InsO family protein
MTVGVRHPLSTKSSTTDFQMLRRSLREYGAHFHHERIHQGLGNVLIMPRASSEHRGGRVIGRPRLGGLLNYYERAAA